MNDLDARENEVESRGAKRVPEALRRPIVRETANRSRAPVTGYGAVINALRHPSGTPVAEGLGDTPTASRAADSTPDPKCVATGAAGGDIVLRSATTREHDMHSPNGRTLANASGDGGLRLWDTASVSERSAEALFQRSQEARLEARALELSELLYPRVPWIAASHGCSS